MAGSGRGGEVGLVGSGAEGDAAAAIRVRSGQDSAREAGCGMHSARRGSHVQRQRQAPDRDHADPRGELPRVVPAGRQGRRPRRELAGPRLHGDQAVGLRALGEHPARARRHVQGDRARERLLPAVHPDVASSRRRPSTSRASPRSARSSRTTGSRPGKDGKLVPAGELEEPLIVRPTSRDDHRRDRSRSGCRAIATCRCSSTSGRTSCAGRCARACSCARPSSSGRRATPRTRPSEEAVEETMQMLDVYAEFAEECMAMPVIKGEKTAGERFPGAVADLLHRGDDAGPQGAAGRHVALPRPELREGAASIKFQDEQGRARATPGRRRGASRRGSSAADHDARRRRRPGAAAAARARARRDPARSSSKRRGARAACSTYCDALADGAARRSATPARRVRVRDRRPRHARRREGVAVGQEGRADPPRDRPARHREGRACSWAAATRAPKEKAARAARRVRREHRARSLQEIQDGLFARALAFRERAHARRSTRRTSSTRSSPSRTKKKPNDPTPIHGGFAMTHFNGDPALEAKIKDDLERHRALHPARAPASPAPARSPGSRAQARRLGEGVLIVPR